MSPKQEDWLDDWVDDCMMALQTALRRLESNGASADDSVLENLYQEAPLLALQQAQIDRHSHRGEQALSFALEERAADFAVDPEVTQHYVVNFLLAFLDTHLHLGHIDEDELDDIMTCIVDSYPLPDLEDGLDS